MKRVIFPFVVVLLLLFAVQPSFAQKWKVYRTQVSAGIGLMNFMGDLGGADRTGTHGLRDMDLRAFRPALSAGYSYRLLKRVGVRGNFVYGWIHGEDKFTKEEYRKNRNLTFRSPIVELSTQAEFYITVPPQGSRYYNLSGTGSFFKRIPVSTYVFAGVGMFYFNPKGEYNGKWYALQPLGTEGQGLVDSRKKYHRLQACIPLGIGVKYALNDLISVGVEFSYRRTFTDYLDDVSTTYFDKSIILSERGEVASFLSDPSKGSIPNATLSGQQRGNPLNNDTYVFSMFTIYYTIAKSAKVFIF